MMSLILLASLTTTDFKPTVDFIDSRDDASITYVIIDQTCKVAVKKKELKDYDKVITKVMKACHL